MPLKLHMTVGNDSLDIEGDFTFDDGLKAVVNEWTRALGPQPGQADVDALAAQMKTQNDELQSAVTAQQ